LCGAVRYRVEGEPMHVGICHCANCHKESGSAFTISGKWPATAFELEGEIATFNGRSFCPRCGSRLGGFYEEHVEIELGSLDDAPFELVPDKEIWVKRREPWLTPVAGAAQHRESPAS
jgi:hypothetical protein